MHPISVCIIAKNEEKRIEKCLRSVKPYGFEIVVVDTGSADRTKEIAAAYADKVLDFVWCDDFSAARNFSLREASNDWILMLDCDEWIQEIDVEELDYFREHHADSVGAVSRRNLVTENGHYVLNNTDNTERFFDRRLYHYTGIIHEQLTPKNGRELPCLLLHTTIGHSGYDMTPEEQRAKSKRNLTLLHRQLSLEPENPYVYYQLGKGYEIIEDYESACEYYGKGLYFDVDPSLAYVQALVISYGNTLLLTGRAEAALGFAHIYDEFAVTADFVYLMGRIYMANGMYPQAIEQFLQATAYADCRFHGANSFLAFYHIALICEQTGDLDNALAYYHECGEYPPAAERAVRLLRKTAAARPRRIVIFRSGLFILQYLADQYAKALEEMGCELLIFNYFSSQEQLTESMEELYAFHEKGIDAVLTFNNYAFNLKTADEKSLWDQWQIPVFNLLWDHPMYYHDTLDDSPAHGIVICEDRTHVAYVKRFCPAVRNAFFIPAGGEELQPGRPPVPIRERSIDVLFVGSYKFAKDCTFDIFDKTLLEYLRSHTHTTFEQTVEDCLRQIRPDVSEAELKYMIAQHRYVDLNLSATYRLKVLQSLVDAGITVTVYGGGWEDTPLYGNPLFDLHSVISFEEALGLMGDSKLVLNQLSWFKDGCCERIFNAMLQSAVCLTDDSVYLKEQFRDDEELVFYSLAEADKLGETAAALLRDPDRMQRIADSGHSAAAARHTWAHRADEFMKLLQELS